MTLAAKQQELTSALAAFKDSQQRLGWLVEQARKRPPLPEALRTDEHRLEGCLARLWVVPEFRDGCCFFQAESDSMIMKSIAGLLCDFYSGQAPLEILAHDPEFLGALGIDQHLTDNRRNGLSRLWETIREFAQRHSAPPPA
jgi:cysteine desulfuration protein SufE